MPRAKKPTDERPKPRDMTISFRVDDDLGEAARKKAQRERRSLAAILRAILSLWTAGKYPSPPVMPGEDVRAKKRKRQGSE